MLLVVNEIVQVGIMEGRFVLEFIENNNLVKITSTDEILFSQGKIQTGFFIYLIIAIEEHFDIIFEDEELKIENFDTVELIESIIKRSGGKNYTRF